MCDSAIVQRTVAKMPACRPTMPWADTRSAAPQYGCDKPTYIPIQILARPDLKPGALRLDDGLASWLDRTAAAGNGVVPLAATRAWRMLKAVLEGDEGTRP